jgi:hypothetical protein
MHFRVDEDLDLALGSLARFLTPADEVVVVDQAGDAACLADMRVAT